jgi:N-acylneuraminate cytidylyltransferase
MDGMVTQSGVLALIPARGGSKSIPRKNVRLLSGLPLIAYSIEAARRAACVDRVVVSTDDPEIAAVARRFGADVPFVRPADLADDQTPDLPVFLQALDWLATHDDYHPDVVVHLRATSPLRPPECVDAAVALLRLAPAVDSVRAVVPSGQNPYKMWRQSDGVLVPVLTDAGSEGYNQPRQSLPPTWWQTGHIDVAWTSTLRDQRSMSGSRIRPYAIDPVYTCDLDTELDWVRTEWQLAHLPAPALSPVVREFPDRVALVVFDFDGVFTDNRVWVAAGGHEWVACSRSDGIGLQALRDLGVPMMVLSTEPNPVVADRCRKLGLPCEHGVADKGARLRALLDERQINPAHVVYVGNDVNDRDCLRAVGCPVVVADAHPSVRAEARLILRERGGAGAVRELCDRLAQHLISREAL